MTDDERPGRELVQDLYTGLQRWSWHADEYHRRGCSGFGCPCGMPLFLHRLTFAVGQVAGMWSKANAEYPAGGVAYDDESTVGRARTSALEDVLRVLSYAVDQHGRSRPDGPSRPPSATPLTATDPEPARGSTVCTMLGEKWFRDHESSPCSWLRLDDNGDTFGDPESWVKVAGNYGPVWVIS